MSQPLQTVQVIELPIPVLVQTVYCITLVTNNSGGFPPIFFSAVRMMFLLLATKFSEQLVGGQALTANQHCVMTKIAVPDC